MSDPRDFLLELRCEEIPSRMQAGARAELERLFREQMAEAGVAPGVITVWSTPRRLALIARALPQATEAVREEAKGPPEGAPDQAIDGFCRKNGVTREQLELRDVKGRQTWFAVIEKPGRALGEVLAEAIPAIIRAFSWPKSMRWGAASLSTESLRWVRPLSGIVAILGEELVAFEIEGIASSYATKGHRFHHPGAITIGGAHDYADKLRACHVLVDHEERQDLIRSRAAEAARAAGLTLIADEGLVVENAGLTEWPVPLLGSFDESFLEVPPEVIQLTARTNQKYFVCEQDGKLANAFVCTANIEAADGGAAIVAGNRKVLAARLSDARFFWDQDRRKTLAEHARGLERITFHDKLGTVADKVERVARLAEWLATEGIVPGCDPKLASCAAQLCKADLVTEMVGEFPELQGVMGGYYARSEGLPDEVADAIRDHYKPVGQGDEVPTAPVTVAVGLADKLDNLFAFFSMRERPTGSKDPFALRRAAIACIALIVGSGLRFHLLTLIDEIDARLGGFYREQWLATIRSYDDTQPKGHKLAPENVSHVSFGYDLLDFFADRLKVQQREAGVRHDLIDAVFALGGEDDLVRLLARVHALQAFVATEDGENLLAGYKRAANILKKEGYETTSVRLERSRETDGGTEGVSTALDTKGADEKPLSYTPEPAEKALMDALASADPEAAQAVEAEDFASAMSALASLRAPIDRFFDHVTVNDADPGKRAARLALLDSFRAAVHKVADFSRIEG